jgi:hypothetical protein
MKAWWKVPFPIKLLSSRSHKYKNQNQSLSAFYSSVPWTTTLHSVLSSWMIDNYVQYLIFYIWHHTSHLRPTIAFSTQYSIGSSTDHCLQIHQPNESILKLDFRLKFVACDPKMRQMTKNLCPLLLFRNGLY